MFSANILPDPDYPAYLLGLIFKEDATAHDLLTIVLSFSVVWAVVFYICGKILGNVSYGRKWLLEASEREYERCTKQDFEKLGMDVSKEEVVDWLMTDWPNVQVMTLQHLFGCILCLPSLLGIGDAKWASSLAVCAVLSEAGWELEDVLRVLYLRFFDNGPKKITDLVLVFSVAHHSLTTVLGLPMALYYRELKAFHWLAFDLQLGASSFALIEYSKLLDITKAKELRRFKSVNLILFLLMVWTRLFHWVYLCSQIILTWYRDEAWMFLKIGVVPIVLFSAFNADFCVVRMYKRHKKFLHVSAEHEALPSDAPKRKRRESISNLEKAAGKLMERTEDSRYRVDKLVQSFEPRKERVGKRQSMPPLRRMSATAMPPRRRMSATVTVVSAPNLVPSRLWKED